MKNIAIAAVLSILLSSCGGYIVNGGGEQAYTESLIGNGYISTEQYNEICPFLYRPSIGGAFLFFSSDRDGTYDIYMSAMNASGQFTSLQKLNAPLNSDTAQDLFPVMYNSLDGPALAFIRQEGIITNVYVYSVDSNFLATGNWDVASNLSPKGLGFYLAPQNPEEEFFICYGNSTVDIYNYDGSVYQNTSPLTLSKSPVSISILKVQTNVSGNYINFMLMGDASGNLMGEVQSYTNFGNTLAQDRNIALQDYQSTFRDITPFMDSRDGFKVYFASDRYGKGNFDLYRYNIQTYNKQPDVASFFNWSPTPQVVINTPSPYFTNAGSFISVNADVSGSTVVPMLDLYCSLDNQSFQLMSPSTGWFYSFSSVPAGIHTVKVYGVDVFFRHSLTNAVITVLTN